MDVCVNKKFVVIAFPRTGSTLVRYNLSNHFGVFVEHTHDRLYRPPSDDFTAVVTRRRNVFDGICSQFVMRHTGEMSVYSGREFDRFDIDLQSFRDLVQAQDDFYKEIDLSCYRQVVKVWFEDLISDPWYLFGQFNIVKKTVYGIQKSPNRYQQLVKNIDDVYACYQSLKQNKGAQ
jgi:hypothetical protein